MLLKETRERKYLRLSKRNGDRDRGKQVARKVEREKGLSREAVKSREKISNKRARE